MGGRVGARRRVDGVRGRSDVDGVRGKVTFRAWQANTIAQDALFEPPSGLARRDVDRADIHRIFSAMFNFAMELTE